MSTCVPRACPRVKMGVCGTGVKQRAGVLEEILGTPRPAGRRGALTPKAPSLPPHPLPQSPNVPPATAPGTGKSHTNSPRGSKRLGAGEKGSPASEGPHQFPQSTPGGHTIAGLGAKVHTLWAPDTQAGCRGGAPLPTRPPQPFGTRWKDQGRSAEATPAGRSCGLGCAEGGHTDATWVFNSFY